MYILSPSIHSCHRSPIFFCVRNKKEQVLILLTLIFSVFHALDNYIYRGADKSLARPGRKQARKHVREARGFNNIETRAVIKFLYLQNKAPKEIHAIPTETLACFLPVRAKDLSAPQGAERNSRHSDRNISLFPSW